jgi:hypothetical protein
MDKSYIFRDKEFRESEIDLIKNIIDKNRDKNRNNLAKLICKELNWYQENGRLKYIACLDVLRRMEKKGLLTLPEGKSSGGYKEIKPLTKRDVKFDQIITCTETITGSIIGKKSIIIEPASNTPDLKLWRYLIQEYHYLGYKRIVGKYLKYFVYLNLNNLDSKSIKSSVPLNRYKRPEDAKCLSLFDNINNDNENICNNNCNNNNKILVALIGFGNGIYHHHLRDKWIGWDNTTLKRNRHLIVNNVRFLILPWIRINNLGSKILSEVVNVLPVDWEKRYGFKPLLLETFVDIQRFKGTVYKAANWILLGETNGEGRRGLNYFYHGFIRQYYVYPLVKDAVKKLKEID